MQSITFAALGAISAAVSLFGASAAGQTLTTLYSFSGSAGQTQNPLNVIDQSGVLYGTTAGGGTTDTGVVFSYTLATGIETDVASIPSGEEPGYGTNPNVPLYLDGTLYLSAVFGGNGYGTINSVVTMTGGFNVLYSFEGNYPGFCEPVGGLLPANGLLYGVALGCGLFSFDPASGAEMDVYDFDGNGDGAEPQTLTAGGALFYGTTVAGGSTTCETNGCGTIFSFNPATGAVATVYSFINTGKPTGRHKTLDAPNLIYQGGHLFGLLTGPEKFKTTLFEVDPLSGSYKKLYVFPYSPSITNFISNLVYLNNTFYVTTYTNANPAACMAPNMECGSIIGIAQVSGHYQQTYAYTFSGKADGAGPDWLTVSGNQIFGTAAKGGNRHGGTLFSITPPEFAR